MSNDEVTRDCCAGEWLNGKCELAEESEFMDRILTPEQLDEYTVGDVFLGGSRRILEPMVLLNVGQRALLGLNEELDSGLRHGYTALYLDLRSESHIDYKGEGHHSGQARPAKHVGRVPEGIEISDRSADLMKWIITEGASIRREGYASLEQYIGRCAAIKSNMEEENGSIEFFEYLSTQLATGRLVINEEYGVSIYTHVKITSEDRFREYLRNSPDDNIALLHPPTAEKYL